MSGIQIPEKNGKGSDIRIFTKVKNNVSFACFSCLSGLRSLKGSETEEYETGENKKQDAKTLPVFLRHKFRFHFSK